MEATNTCLACIDVGHIDDPSDVPHSCTAPRGSKIHRRKSGSFVMQH